MEGPNNFYCANFFAQETIKLAGFYGEVDNGRDPK